MLKYCFFGITVLQLLIAAGLAFTGATPGWPLFMLGALISSLISANEN